jgi:hypothetical protein
MRSSKKNVCKKRDKARQRIIVIASIFFILVLAGSYLLRLEIDISGFEQQIVAEAAPQLKGKVAMESATFCLLPSPHITLRGIRIEPFLWGDFTAAKILVDVRLLPLRNKKLVVKKISIQRPVLNLIVRKESNVWEENILTYIKNNVLPVIPSLALHKGQVNILRPKDKEPFFTLVDVRGTLAARKKEGVRLDLFCACQGAEKIEIKVASQRLDEQRQSCSLLAAGTGVTIEALRGVILELFGKNETVQTVFGIIRGGQLSRLVLQGDGSSFEEALDFERNMKVRGTCVDGRILAPPAPFPLEEVSGEFEIKKAVLRCWDADLRLGRSTARKGELVVGLISKREVFHLDLLINAAAEDLVRYLPLVIGDKELIRELGNFREAEGWGEGRLVLGENIHHMSPQVQVNDFQLSFYHASSPERVSLSGGRLSLQNDKSAWRIDSVIWKGFKWTNVEGSTSFGDRGIEITVAKANLCGLQCEGSTDSHAGILTHAYRIRTEEGDLSSTLKCLWGKDARIEGKFLFDGDMWAEGTEDPLREASEGTLYFSSQHGRIYRWTLLSRLFSTLNLIGLFQGKFPDFRQQGFPYDQFIMTGELRNGYIYLKDAVIDGPGMKIVGEGKIDLVKGETDMVVLLAPLRTIDTIMHNVPIVGKIMTGKNGVFLSVPFSVKGRLDNPAILLLPTKAVGSGLWGVLKRTLQSPVEMFKAITQAKPSLLLH